jgi:hypothetical protein
MSVILTNPDFPHSAVISRTTVSATPPFTVSTPEVIWEGECDCQSSVGGSTVLSREVYVSDYTIFCESISVPIKTGDTVSVTFVTDGTPVDMVIEQSETSNIWVEGEKTYGTTIWCNKK